MSYSTSNPPRMISAGGIGGGSNIWLYSSTDAKATVDGSGYITDGYKLGMRMHDQVLVVDTTNKISSWHYVVTATSTAVDLSDGTSVGVSTNSD